MGPLPRLRTVDAFPVDVDGRRLIHLRDPEGFSDRSIGVPPHVFHLMTQLDGARSAEDLRRFFADHYGGAVITEAQIGELVRSLDEALFLDSPQFRAHRAAVEAEYRQATVRPAAHAGASYPEDPEALRRAIDGFFDPPEGPGRPDGAAGGTLKGLVAPHIDFGRGGPCFAWAYQALASAPPADVFVVFGTGHTAQAPFTTSFKAFQTPLGPLPADARLVDRLVSAARQDLLADELAHRREHSIEFQAVFLKYLYADRDITIVPVLCGSFHELVEAKKSPAGAEAVEDFVSGLREALSGEARRVCFIAGVDFSHVGQRFGDEGRVDDDFITRVERSDRDLIEAAERADAEAFFDVIVRDGDRHRVCGTSSIYTMLRVMDAERGELLKYDRAVEEGAGSLVSFASMAFR